MLKIVCAIIIFSCCSCAAKKNIDVGVPAPSSHSSLGSQEDIETTFDAEAQSQYFFAKQRLLATGKPQTWSADDNGVHGLLEFVDSNDASCKRIASTLWVYGSGSMREMTVCDVAGNDKKS